MTHRAKRARLGIGRAHAQAALGQVLERLNAVRVALGHEHDDAGARQTHVRAERVAHFLLNHVEVRRVAGHEQVGQSLVAGLHFADERPATGVDDVDLAAFALPEFIDGFLDRLAVHLAAVQSQARFQRPRIAGDRLIFVRGKHPSAFCRRGQVSGKLQRQRRATG